MLQKSKIESDSAQIDPIHPAHGIVGMIVETDAVFGNVTEDGPNYRNVGWIGTTALMMKTQIGLGVLSMPLVFGTLGLIPGNILLLTIAGITTWSNYMIGVFKLRHPEVYGIDDVGRMFFGQIGCELFGAAYALFYTVAAGSAMLSISTALNALSSHAVCTAAFVAVAAVIGFAFGSIRTLDRIGVLAWIGAISIIIAVFIVTIAVGLQDRPSAAPSTGIWKSDYKIVNNPSFTDAVSAISTLVFTYAGTPAFFNIAAEMRQPLLYTRALAVCQTTVTMVYVIVGTIIYYYCGSYVASPALGSAGVTIKKVAYGISLPGLIVSCVLFVHLPAKHTFVRILRGSNHLTANSVIHWVTWLGSTSSVALIAYIVASAIPVFSGLVSLIGALLGTFLTFHPYAGMWLYDNCKNRERTLSWYSMVGWCIFIFVAGTFLTIVGTYGSIVSIVDSYTQSGGTPAWSCADNSNST
ncbi:amino acid transporter, putative [Aspergillus oryzae 100-8]|uniref:Amino acid transporter, putative n=1 Tax=Aspergillus oryzae (strain 3.042) TaxID=1160506 RepID=I8ITP9_ASPO3|nr:amino acid transporter, putative [Aspergillus oryzae 3.042]KDE83779.1 amino acid transporter, putative [Aspergillus oryzae 100-8]|eukprot:EIT82831.1 amino acid transporter, putative [Aspergillus oryzae 3.042]